ncbi:MAG: hypothetical protein QOG23_4414 [Blastocatellia bacterium]|jgi:hypothetical protein|nr:hypothetical protein [Blastocatellia bacterium]
MKAVLVIRDFRVDLWIVFLQAETRSTKSHEPTINVLKFYLGSSTVVAGANFEAAGAVT